MSDSDYNVLTAALSPRVTTETDQGWEESTDAAVTHLLRTTLSKSQKEATLSVAAVEMPSESSKLKKHIALLCERVLKGGRPATGKIEVCVCVCVCVWECLLCGLLHFLVLACIQTYCICRQPNHLVQRRTPPSLPAHPPHPSLPAHPPLVLFHQVCLVRQFVCSNLLHCSR